MHLGFDLCAEEQAFLSRRKQVVAKALKQALQLDRDLQEDEVWGTWVQYLGLALRKHLIPLPSPDTPVSETGVAVWGVGVSFGVFTPFWPCPGPRAVTSWGRSWALGLTPTPSGPGPEVPSLRPGPG